MARSRDAATGELLHASAASLAGFADDPASLVTACRRLLDRHPAQGPVWWLCSRTITAADPADEAWRCLDDFVTDPSIAELAHALPDGARVCVAGWSDRLIGAFAPRGDVEVRVVDVEGDGPGFVRELEGHDVNAVDVAVTGLAAAAASSDLVVLDATAVGPDIAITASGAWALAAVAHTARVPVWVASGVGRIVPAAYWPALAGRVRGAATAPWGGDQDFLPLDLVDRLVGPNGPDPVEAGLSRGDTPLATELTR